MPRPARDTRRRILENAYRLFYREGFQRAGVDALAEAAGVTKRTLYNHFPSKDALIGAVLEAQADLAEAEIRRWCGEDPAMPEVLIGRIFAGLPALGADAGLARRQASPGRRWSWPGHPVTPHAGLRQRRSVRSSGSWPRYWAAPPAPPASPASLPC